MIDIDNHQLDELNIDKADKINIDAYDFFEYINKKPSLPEKIDWLDHCKWLKEKYTTCDGFIPSNKTFLTHFEASQLISDFLPEGSTIVTGSSGLAIESFYVAYRPKDSQRILLTSGLGAMGYGLPALIGVNEAIDDTSKSFLIESDGSLMLNLQELQTFATRDYKSKIIILNNNGYCSIRSTQKTYFGGNFVASGPSSGLEIPSIEKLANTFNIHYHQITAANKLSLPKVLQKKGASIIEILLVEQESLWPKVSAVQQPDGSMISMPLEDMSPLLSLSDLQEALGPDVPIKPESKQARNDLN